MARTTKQLSGGGKDKFLRALVAGETTIPADAAARLGDNLCASIADIRVRRETWETVRATPAVEAAAPPVVQAAAEPVAPKSQPATTPMAGASQAAAFDPFAFSALATLTKKGAAALSARLAEIGSAGDLHALAAAQHLSIDTGVTDLQTLRAAILAATQARLAERRAAAS
jgi:hypothetical protein